MSVDYVAMKGARAARSPMSPASLLGQLRPGSDARAALLAWLWTKGQYPLVK